MRCQPPPNKLVYICTKNNQSCLLCNESTDNPYPLCVPCEAELPWLHEHCQVCALPLPFAGLTCGQCSKHPPAFERVEAPWYYGFPIDALITRFKHNSRWPFGRLLAELLGHWLEHSFDEGLPRPQRLLPVPMARKRLRQRGFNQAAMLANWLSASLDITCDEHLLLRSRETQAQQDLDALARKRNLRHAFALAPGAQVKGMHLALVDDVLTTGATADALARLLIDAGAARVDVYCLARTPKPGST
ncbi:ComF family protein [Pseudomonas akapageensis]|uniref:ComF family protein n=1 Tax=Pseudomonas akapageensis TaxID=2609961 RepID=UPI0014092717|nr:ComF family protein [Pseudomonas akapageensis]